jgi:hypothetical protein
VLSLPARTLLHDIRSRLRVRAAPPSTATA